MRKTKTTAAEVALDKSIYTKSINHRESRMLRGVITNNEPAAEEFHYHSGSNCDACANAFYNKNAPARYYARRAFPDVKVLEELFVEATLALLSSLPVRLAKTHLAHWYTQKTLPRRYSERLYRRLPLSLKPSDFIAQLGISYQTLQDIRCTASTDADFGKALADRST